MAGKKTPDNCLEHTIEINNIKKDMETRIRHEERFVKTIERVEDKVDVLSDTTKEINSTLSHFKDMPERVRKLEDKSIVTDLIKLGLGIALGVFITNYVEDLKAYNRERNDYKIEKNK